MRRRLRRHIEAAAPGFAHGEEQHRSKQHARYRRDPEGHTPAIGRADRAGERDTGGDADRHSEIEDRHRAAAPFGRIMIGDERIGGRGSSRLARTDADPRQREVQHRSCRAGERGEAAPQQTRNRDDPNAVGPIGDPGDRDRDGHVEEREDDAREQAEHRIRQREFGLDALREHREELAIGIVERINDGEQEQHPAR